jgi:DNA-binding winged helix-turn-helix (wHTH) protein
MKKRKLVGLFALVIIAWSAWSFVAPQDTPQDISEKTKTVLREVGHQLLLTQQDTTSLILPVVALNDSRYKISFEYALTFNPTHLVSIVDDAFTKAVLPEAYRVSVIQCEDGEVAYSYEMTADKATTLIPCGGRLLPKKCYTIVVTFINKTSISSSNQIFLYVLIVIAFLIGLFFLFKKKSTTVLDLETLAISEGRENNSAYTNIGIFKFYPEQHTLVKEAEAIPLSKKECELLALFIEQPNKVITRDELTKKIWEDHGVIVSRSLDTYISKLRKKLKSDERIKISNVHGVGYKLEILKNKNGHKS